MKMKKNYIKQYSLQELRERRNQGLTQTKMDALEHPVDPHFWDNVQLVAAAPRVSIHLRLEKDIFEWFKSQGSGHLTRMNAVLKSYYEAHQHH
jgi:uncharacterized protein (DUF4415 family)